MTYPAFVIYTGSISWPTQRNFMGGPFEVNLSGTIYTLAFLPDLRSSDPHWRVCYSVDSGHTWAEADEGSAPVLVLSPGTLRHGCVSQNGTTFYLYAPSGATGCDIHVFDATTMTWGTTLVGPSVTWGTTNAGQTAVYGFYRSSSSDHVIFCQVPTETVGTPFRRCALYYGTPGSWTGPLHLPTGTTSLPGVAEHYDLFYAQEGDSRLHVYFGDSAGASSSQLRARSFSASNVFGAIVNLTVTSTITNSQFPFGMGCAYSDTTTHIAAFYATGTLTNVTANVIRVESSASDLDANWTKTVVAVAGGETALSNPGAVMSDGGDLLFLLRVRDDQALDFTQDSGSDTWDEFRMWRESTSMIIYGVSARYLTLTNRVGYMYYLSGDDPGLRFDAINVYMSKASKGAGTYTTEHDLGIGGVSDYVILKNSSVPSGVSSVIEVRMRDDEGAAWGEAVITLGTEEGTDSRDEGHTGQTARFIQITEIVTGGAVESGVAGY